ncbi:hypothetical protein PTTG_00436, partial [Puccinia triticina 1-1 BBBD Race 1]
SMHPALKNKNGDVLSKIDTIKDKLLAMNPAQLDFQLAAINRILEGTGMKTTLPDASAFEDVKKKWKNEEIQSKKIKKQKVKDLKAAKKKKKADEKKEKEQEEEKLEDRKPKRGQPLIKKPVAEERAKKRVLPARKGRSAPPKEPQELLLLPKKHQEKPAPPKKQEDVSEDEEQPAPKRKFCPIKKANRLHPTPEVPLHHQLKPLLKTPLRKNLQKLLCSFHPFQF